MNYIILALATWRLSNLLVEESGPWQMFDRLRALVGVRYDGETFQRTASNTVAAVFACIWCMSVWVGLFWTLLYWWQPQTFLLALPLALSAAAIWMDKNGSKSSA